MQEPIRYPTKQLSEFERFFSIWDDVSTRTDRPVYPNVLTADFLKAVHPGIDQYSNSFVSIVTKNSYGARHYDLVAYGDLNRHVGADGRSKIHDDLFISTSVFGKTRTVSQLRGLGSCSVTLDYKKTKWGKRERDEAASAIRHALGLQGLPLPSFIIASYEQLHCIWLIKPVPRSRLPDWSSVQSGMGKALSGFKPMKALGNFQGYIPLVGSGTSHSRNHNPALVIWWDGSTETPRRYAFEDLSVAYVDGDEQAAHVSERREHARTLDDLQRLREIRHGDGPMSGETRTAWITAASVSVARLCPMEWLHHEIEDLCREASGWQATKSEIESSAEYRDAISCAFNQFWDDDQGVSPTHEFTATKIVKALKISRVEARAAGLEVLIPEQTKGAERARRFRLAHGAKDHGTQRNERLEIGMRALILQGQGIKRSAIAKALGVSTGHVSNAIALARSASGTKLPE